jgi:hypothetical protein
MGIHLPGDLDVEAVNGVVLVLTLIAGMVAIVVL